ncbi:hypothetical protein [Salinimonas chungwhensis]|jgi:hypothetical protein|uniref:hypothetical protein n=1 Tax=Salinimonas chungwhensis TaxID=265425 RepID=UPI00036C4B26|nr:hypothetical protein [Salinimonas chungwhensis]
MKKQLIGGVLFCVFSFLTIQNTYADDHEPPFIGGNYWEVTGIKTADGASLKYSKWLASEWRKNMEFAVSKEWLQSYTVLYNMHARSDEPDIYIVQEFTEWASEDENEKRRGEYMEWAKKSMEKMESESGDRAEYRTVMGTMLLQEMKPRNK